MTVVVPIKTTRATMKIFSFLNVAIRCALWFLLDKNNKTLAFLSRCYHYARFYREEIVWMVGLNRRKLCAFSVLNAVNSRYVRLFKRRKQNINSCMFIFLRYSKLLRVSSKTNSCEYFLAHWSSNENEGSKTIIEPQTTINKKSHFVRENVLFYVWNQTTNKAAR